MSCNSLWRSIVAIYFQILLASARSDDSGSSERSKLIQIVGDRSEYHLDMDSPNCGNEHMSSLEDFLYDCKWPLARRSYFRDLQITSLVPGA